MFLYADTLLFPLLHILVLAASWKDLSVSFKWCNVGVLDYDPSTQQWLVQKIDDQGRVLTSKGYPIVNGGLRKKSKKLVPYF